MTAIFDRLDESNINIFRLEGDIIGQYQFPPVFEYLQECLDNEESLFIVDLEKVRVINSTGLTLLLTILTKSRNKGGDVVLINPNELLDKLLIITKLKAIFSTAETEEKAIKLLQKG